jgi:hypothetical protein
MAVSAINIAPYRQPEAFLGLGLLLSNHLRLSTNKWKKPIR